MKRSGLWPVAVLMLMAVGPAPGHASDSPDAKEQDDTPLPVSSPYLTMQFSGDLEKVRESFQALLKEDGLALKEDPKNPAAFSTDMVHFDDKKFGMAVSTPPPRANPKYPWLQSIAANSGRYGLEGRFFSTGAQTTRIELRAIIEVTAINTRKGGTAWVPRYSNGTIEHLTFSRLALKLLPPATADGASR